MLCTAFRWRWVIPQAWTNTAEGSPVCTEGEAYLLPGGGRGYCSGWKLPSETIDEMRRDFDVRMERESVEVRMKLDLYIILIYSNIARMSIDYLKGFA